MLVQCNKGCKLSDGTTSAVLDSDTGEAHCEKCDEILNTISSFGKISLKSLKAFRNTNKKKAFSFKCLSCNKMVETEIALGAVKGKDCKEGKCKINISDAMKNAMESILNVGDI